MEGWKNTDLALFQLGKTNPGFDAPSCLLKAVTINALYGTQVLAIVRMARHAEEVVRQADLKTAGLELVQKIAEMPPRDGDRPRIFLSFAAKFCHFFVDAERFPIYDEAARVMLRLHLGEQRYPLTTLERYSTFCEAFGEVHKSVGLEAGRDLDRYLWISGMYERWLRQRKKKNPEVNAELLRLFTSPSQQDALDLDTMLPASFPRPGSPG
jgi:hypothetical protein